MILKELTNNHIQKTILSIYIHNKYKKKHFKIYLNNIQFFIRIDITYDLAYI